MLTSRIKQAFNKAATSYDQHSALQLHVGETLLNYLPNKHKLFSHILDAGCGTGSVTKIIAANCHYYKLTGIDIAENSLKKAEEKVKPYSVQFSVADFNHILPPASYDLIFSNMALHWSKDLMATFHHLNRVLSRQGTLAFSLPLIDTLETLKPYCAIHDFYSVDNIQTMLSLAGLHQASFFLEKITLPFSDWKSALYSLKNIGANYASQRFRGLYINPNLKKLIDTMTQTPITLTYHIGYFMIEKTQ